jgi:hypothetical protein
MSILPFNSLPVAAPIYCSSGNSLDFVVELFADDGVTIFDLSDKTAKLQVRKTPGANSALLALDTTSGLTFDVANGLVYVSFTASQTASLPAGVPLNYSLRILDGANFAKDVIAGTFLCIQEPTQ